MDVSKRIEFIIDNLEAVETLADIGTDHGYVPLIALERGLCNKTIACDINKDPLDKARLNAILEGVGEELEFRLGGGFEPLKLNEANEVDTVDVLKATKVPDDCKVLVISTLKEDITGVEKDAILSYIKNGGEILLLSDPNFGKIKFKNFQKVLDEYGIKISEGFILEADENQMLAGQPDFVISNVKSGSSIINGIGMEMNICLIAPAKITLASSEQLEKKNVVSEIFATVSDKAFYRTDLTSNSPTKTKSDEEAAGATVGAVLTKKIDDNTSSKLVVFANTRFATNDGIYMTPQNYMYYLDFYNNKDVILNSVAYLTEREDTITIRKNVEAVNYTVTAQQNRIVLGIIFAIPAFIIIVGITVWIMRRRKK